MIKYRNKCFKMCYKFDKRIQNIKIILKIIIKTLQNIYLLHKKVLKLISGLIKKILIKRKVNKQLESYVQKGILTGN